MNFTLLVVALVMIHVYLVVAMPKGESSNKRQKTSGPYGCQIVEKPAVEDKGKEEHIVCKKGNEKIGGLYYTKHENTKTITIELINVDEDYRRDGFGQYLLDYFRNT
ncbi:hypothetical protein Ddc_10504 [Ditylenchus destructor]|nr:hypothetical protein Ddc_10504 [Ditylenchus destructor]